MRLINVRTFLIRSLLVLSGGASLLNCASGEVRDDASFSYKNLYETQYVNGDGGIIPITMERGESYSGSISADQKYLYYSSNTSGNYDIFLRDLTDVFSIPVVSTVTNQREPSISPDGKYLLYVDDELDPDGDIVLLKVDPKKKIDNYRKGKENDDGWFSSSAKNLTNSEKNRVRARDANPTWSPDGKSVAWSTDLVPSKADDLGAGAGALQNIWVMPVSNPGAKRQVTTLGGVMPSFSPDGTRLVYISYEDEASHGAVYEIDLATLARRKFTTGNQLDFYPTYTADGKSIVLTRIAHDSNNDGQIDRKDAGQIIRIFPDGPEDALVDEKEEGKSEKSDLTTSASNSAAEDDRTKKTEKIAPKEVIDQSALMADDDFVPLTSPSDSVFDSRVTQFIGGSVVLAQLKGEDINVAFIPLSGSIPIKGNMRHQLRFLQTQAKKTKDKARICMGLEQLPAAFENSPNYIVYDALSAMRSAQCSKETAAEFSGYLASLPADELVLYRLLFDVAKIDPEYADLADKADLEPLADLSNIPKYFESVQNNKKLWEHYRDDEDNTDYLAILTFIRHEEALYYVHSGKHKEAQKAIRRILRQNPNYIALDELLFENGALDTTTLPAAELIYVLADKPDATLLPDYFASDKNDKITIRPWIRRRAEKAILAFYEKQLAAGNRQLQEQFLEAYPASKNKSLNALYRLASARDYSNKGLYTESESDVAQVRKLAPAGSLYHYYASIVSAENAEIQKGADAAMAIYMDAVRNYRDSETPTNVRTVIAKIGAYFKNQADARRAVRDDKGEAQVYQGLLDLYLAAHGNKWTKELNSGEMLDFTLSLDQIGLRAATKDEKLLKSILSFYDSRIDLARRDLVTEFIFGRGFLRAQLGIERHLRAEAEGLTKSEKKAVFEYFRKAEIDLNWCFFANPRFADAYIMLGWMYQFIDEKREVVLDVSSGKRDREIFESLYKSFFPDYLFEKNIRLYQRTLALFAGKGSARVRNSFHLNIANNYFLLNNYSQAEEHYTAILDKNGNPNYQFETPEQEMMFYYHLGRTLYFTGKNDAAARYLRYVENNLNPRYPIVGVDGKTQRLNQARREIAYKTFALNSEYSQNLPAAINYLQTVLIEHRQTASPTPVSLIHLELARLYLRSGDLTASLENTQKAESALSKEEEIPIPKYKIRIKWFWVYEPWTWLVGLIYKLPYDDVVIGENHLAFVLPTVNRYELMYSIRAEIYRSKGLLAEASQALGKLIEYAKKDNTKHGRETLNVAVSRRAELEFSLRSWDGARALYEDALKQAVKSKNSAAALTFRKNIELCKLRKLETEVVPVSEKIKTAHRYAAEIDAYENRMFEIRLKSAKARVEEKADPDHPQLTEAEIKKLRENVQSEFQSVLFFKGLYLAHEAQLADFEGKVYDRVEDFDTYLTRKNATFSKYQTALKYFRGFSASTSEDIYPAFEPDSKNNSLRIKLAMNRAKILQEMNLAEESATELKTILERSQEFNAQLEYAIAAYRLYRVHEDAGDADKVSIAPYQSLVKYFLDNAWFLKENTDLFERLSDILADRAIKRRDYAEALRIEDRKKQAVSLFLYFNDLKFVGDKNDSFSQLLGVETQRGILSTQIRNARLARQNSQVLEKALLEADKKAQKLRQALMEPDSTGYHYETLFSVGVSEKDLATAANDGILYALSPRDETLIVYARTNHSNRGARVLYELKKIDKEKPFSEELERILKATKASTLIFSAPLFTEIQKIPDIEKLSLQTSLRAAVNFVKNKGLAERSVLQLAKVSSFFSFGGGNTVDYKTSQKLLRVHNLQEVKAAALHRNVIDYEAALTRKAVVIDNALLTPAALFALRSNPNYAITSFQSRDTLQNRDIYDYMLASDLYFSALGAGRVLHTFQSRAKAQPAIEAYLTDGAIASGTLLIGDRKTQDNKKALSAQKAIYLAKVEKARKERDYTLATAYADDAVSIFPDDDALRLLAAELYFIQGERVTSTQYVQQVQFDNNSSLAEKRNYFKMLLRAADENKARQFFIENKDLKKNLSKDAAEYEALRQLNALQTGNLSELREAAPWQAVTETREVIPDLKIKQQVKSEELKNEICQAATDALEFQLILSSCLQNRNADTEERVERARIKAWFTNGKKDFSVSNNIEDIEFNHALSLLEAGFAKDALPFIQKILVKRNQTTSEHLLAFSLLRILAERKATEDINSIAADLLTEYGNKSIDKAKNAQAVTFYRLLASTGSVYKKGAAAIFTAPPEFVATSGVKSAQNLMALFGATVKPLPEPIVVAGESSFESDKKVKADLLFLNKAIDKGSADVNCATSSCSLLVKYYITQEKLPMAIDLVLRQQGMGRSWENLQTLPKGSYGYTELFTDETYLWSFNGAEFAFKRMKSFDEETTQDLSSSLKYLAYAPKKNLFVQKEITPPRGAILISGSSTTQEDLAPVAELALAKKQDAPLYSVLYAEWGRGSTSDEATKLVVKAAQDSTSADLSVYANPIALDSLGNLQPRGYHLFCTSADTYGGFASFTQTMVRHLEKEKTTIEDAYISALKSLKGKQASMRSMYYLYRN